MTRVWGRVYSNTPSKSYSHRPRAVVKRSCIDVTRALHCLVTSYVCCYLCIRHAINMYHVSVCRRLLSFPSGYCLSRTHAAHIYSNILSDVRRARRHMQLLYRLLEERGKPVSPVNALVYIGPAYIDVYLSEHEVGLG